VKGMPAFLDRSIAKPTLSRRKDKAPAIASGRKHRQVVGLKIGASQLAAAVVVNNGNPSLVTAVREMLPSGVVAGGEPRDPEALSRAIDDFFRTHHLPRKNVRLGIGSSRVGVRVFERPAVDDPRQLANAIRFRAHEALPVAIEESMLDYHLISGREGAERVLLAVANRDLVDRLAASCAAAKIELLGVDVEAFGLLRALGGPLLGDDRGEAARVAVSIGHDRTIVAVSDGRICEFTRVLEWGGSDVTAAIERAIAVDAEEAERLKRSLDLSAGTQTTGSDHPTSRAAEAAVNSELEKLARELASSLHFYQSQPDSLGFAEITITGGSSHLQGLAQKLEKLIGVSVRIADPFERVGPGRDIVSGGQTGSLAVAIGLGIED
jgi:type IV pilus assembly protein PilM